MLEIFRLDAESQIQTLNESLIVLERTPAAAQQMEACMRAAHSLKGAASVIGIPACVRVAHALEDCFVAAQRGTIALRQKQIDVLFSGVDLVDRISRTPETELGAWTDDTGGEVAAFLAHMIAALEDAASQDPPASAPQNDDAAPATAPRDGPDRLLRVRAQNLNVLLAVAGESLVQSHWMKPFAQNMLRLGRLHNELSRDFDSLREALPEQSPEGSALANVQRRFHALRDHFSANLEQLDTFEHRSGRLAQRLYDEALACRMQPFADGLGAFARMVRDIARSLGKQARLDIIGAKTPIDREILAKLDAPLLHLLRNALDHGIESPEERRAAGKPEEGVLQLEAHHSAGMVHIVVSDDGRGIDREQIREAIVARNLATHDIAQALSETELFRFLFLPGFTLKASVTDVSGRGVGLDVVHSVLNQVHGTVSVSSTVGTGSRFLLQLPLSLSVVRAILVEVGGESYAFPLASVTRALTLRREHVASLEGRAFFMFEGHPVGVVSARQLFNHDENNELAQTDFAVIVIGMTDQHAIIVDRFLGERDLIVQTLDARLGKIGDIAAGALLEDGSPVLIVDVEDLLRSVERFNATGHPTTFSRASGEDATEKRKRVLVVDDSLAVREMERKLLEGTGYDVDVAVDGMDGWNAVRTGHFDLVVTDIDMPRMDGIELIGLIKNNPRLTTLPIMIVSYKDREDDRRRGLDAGADYYLSKGNFHDDALRDAVVDLIGEALT
jgi:two-component system sensor histidine kinase and response regulator WspE